jgi:hypothetical protein
MSPEEFWESMEVSEHRKLANKYDYALADIETLSFSSLPAKIREEIEKRVIEVGKPAGTRSVCGPQCVDGTEDHDWTGPVVKLDNGASSSCSKCGQLSISVSMWY